MSKYRFAARIDNNQKEIVNQLRSIPGVTVALHHDDILVGRNGKTFWYEVKNPVVLKKDGGVIKGKKKDSQIKLEQGWTGHYKIVSTIDEILKDIGVCGAEDYSGKR